MSISTSYGYGASATPMTNEETAALALITGLLFAIGVVVAFIFGAFGWLTAGLLLIAAGLLFVPAFMDNNSGARSGGGGAGASACYWLALLLIIGTVIYGCCTMPPTDTTELINCFKKAGHKVQCSDDPTWSWDQRREREKQFPTLRISRDELDKTYDTTLVYELMLDNQKPFIVLLFHSKSAASKATAKFPGSFQIGQWVFLNTTSTTATAIRSAI